MDDLTVIVLALVAAGGGVFLARQQGAPTAATPAGLVYNPPAGDAAVKTAPPTGRVYAEQQPRYAPSPYYPISADPVTNMLREIGHAGNYPTIQQRRVARNIAGEHFEQLYAARPELFCVGPEGGKGLIGFG